MEGSWTRCATNGLSGTPSTRSRKRNWIRLNACGQGPVWPGIDRDSIRPFEKVFVRDDGGLVYRALSPGQNDFGLLVDSDGERLLAFDIPYSRMVFFGGMSVLAAWNDPAGTLIAVYDVEGG